MVFQFEATADVRGLKLMIVIDGQSRICLASRVGWRCKAKDVVAMLDELTTCIRLGVYPIGRQLGVHCPGPTGLV